MNPENGRYIDEDDSGVVSFGRLAGATDSQAVKALVKRYYAAGAAHDGAKACAMLVPSLAHAVPEDYGQGSGSTYFGGAKTCDAVMSRLFERTHNRFSAAFAVTDVRVKGDDAYALLGSKRAPASYVIVKRTGGGWKLNGLFGGPLP